MNKIDKRIFKALEENSKSGKLGNLVGGFVTILIGSMVISELSKEII